MKRTSFRKKNKRPMGRGICRKSGAIRKTKGKRHFVWGRTVGINQKSRSGAVRGKCADTDYITAVHKKQTERGASTSTIKNLPRGKKKHWRVTQKRRKFYES